MSDSNQEAEHEAPGGRLISLQAFSKLLFVPGSAPSLRTLKRRINEIPGGKTMFGRYWVDLDEFERKTQRRRKIEDEITELKSHPSLKGLF